MSQLTPNGIRRMLAKEQDLDSVVVQVLSYSMLNAAKGQPADRHKMVLSDGKYSYNTCITHQQMHDQIVKRKEIDDFAVIKAELVKSRLGPKHVLVASSITLIEKPGKIIGDPIPIPPAAVRDDGTVDMNMVDTVPPPQNGDTRAPLQNQQMNDEEMTDAGPETERRAPQQPTTGGQFRPPAISDAQRTQGGGGGLKGMANGFSRNQGGQTGSGASSTACHPIASLTPYQNKWRICARVTKKEPMRTWNNARGEGKLFSMTFLDQSGEIRATAFKAEADKFFTTIQENGVYYVSGGSIKPANKQFTSVKNDYELAFTQQTTVEACYDQTNCTLPTVSFDFTKLDRLGALPNKTMVDVIGIVKGYGDLVSFTSKTKNQPLEKRDVTLLDDTQNSVNLTLWGDRARDFNLEKNSVLAVKGVSTSDFNGVSVSSGFSSEMHPNPDIPESHKLRGWYDKTGYRLEFTSLTTQGSGGAMTGKNDPPKLIGVAEAQNLGGDVEKGDYFNVKGSILYMDSGKALYMACGNETGCNKKVVDQGNGMYRCEKCQIELPSFKYRFNLNIQISDFTGAHYVTVFGEVGEAILGKSSDELGLLKDNDENAFQEVFAEAMFKTFIFTVKARSDTYNDETKIKWTCIKATPVDQEQQKLFLQDQITKLERMH